MANEGHIIIKGGSKSGSGGAPRDINRFFTKIDAGSSRPAFCMPRHIAEIKGDVEAMRNNMDQGFVPTDQRMRYNQKYKELRDRYDQLVNSQENAAAIIKEDPDGWAERRKELASEISAGMPTEEAIAKRKVNPHKVLRDEKERGLERKKQEFIIISKAMQSAGYEAESNIESLQREK